MPQFCKVIGRVGLVGMIVALAGCSSPLAEESTKSLRQSVVESAQREVRDAERRPDPRPLERTPMELSFPPDRMTELETMAGPKAYSGESVDIGPGLLGEPAPLFQIDLQQSVMRSARQNLDVQRSRFDPAITEAQTIAARAAFDWTFFGGVDWTSTDAPQVQPFIGVTPVGVGVRQNQSIGYETGIRKRLTSGGSFSISQGQTYRDNTTPGASFAPDPSETVFLDIAATQPLLRGAGSDVALAEIRLAENTERRAIYDYKARLIETVTRTEQSYWRLVQAYRDLQIRRRLLERGIETRDVLSSRLSFDVKPAEFSEAVATVERRRANLIRAGNVLRQQSDVLKVLINDDELTVGSEVVLLPTDEVPETPIQFSLLDSVTRALQHRPEVQQAILSIDDSSIRQVVADNARLPLLDMSFRARFQGLHRETDRAYEQITDGRFVDFLVSAMFEQPIGNRGAEAGYRARQLERMRATVEYRRVVQRVVLDVKTALRNITTNYQLIEQTRSARLAATENLRTLLVQEKTIQSLTPDFLDLKFRRQEALALAEADEQAALTDYNISLADLQAAMGTALEHNRIAFVVPDVGGNAGAAR